MLVVDDDAATRAALAWVLEGEGFAVRGAADGFHGLLALRSHPRPLAVLLDLHMARMDGLQFRVEQLRSPDIRAIPVILYSGRYDVMAVAARLDFAAVFRKPIDANQLLTVLRRVIS